MTCMDARAQSPLPVRGLVLVLLLLLSMQQPAQCRDSRGRVGAGLPRMAEQNAPQC
jgi:hypothetical protein